MSAPAAAPPVAFSLAVPASWFELEVSPARRDAAIRAQVAARLREDPHLGQHRAGVERLLREQARRAFEAGAVHCACMVEPTPDGPITASITVSVVDGPLDAASADPDRTAALLERLRPEAARDEADTWTAVGTATLDGGVLAARSWGVEDVVLPEGAGTVRSVVMQTFVPVPGERRVVLVSAASPVLPLADVLLDLFDAVTSTFRLVDAATAATAAEGDR